MIAKNFKLYSQKLTLPCPVREGAGGRVIKKWSQTKVHDHFNNEFKLSHNLLVIIYTWIKLGLPVILCQI